MPDRIFISVDLPAPFSPITAWTSPRATSSRTLCKAGTPENDLEMPSIFSTVSPEIGCAVVIKIVSLVSSKRHWVNGKQHGGNPGARPESSVKVLRFFY